MRTNQRSQGPWTSDGADVMAPETRWRCKNEPITTVNIECAEWPKNALLIAAAPELLVALIRCLHDDAGNLEPETVHLAMIAIRKAQGE